MNRRIIEDISNFVFVEDTLEKADIIFIPGGAYLKLGEYAAKLWREGYAEWIMPSGRFSILKEKFPGVNEKKEIYKKDYKTECEFLTDVLIKNGVEKEWILEEDKASFTQENARFSKKIVEDKKIEVKKAIICCKNFHARRCLMYYQFAFPNVEFMIYPIPYCDGELEVKKENWYQTKEGTNLILGELRRYGEQFKEEFEIFRKNGGFK